MSGPGPTGAGSSAGLGAAGRRGLRDALTQGQPLLVRQQREWVELLSFETRNRYAIQTPEGQTLGAIGERSTGLSSLLVRGFLGSKRPLDVRVLEADGSEWLRLTRPFVWWFSSLDVTGPDGTPQGRIERRFGLTHRRYDLLGPHGRVFARIQAPRWRVWTFPVEGEDGVSRAEIAKRWGGATREMFTDADTFRVQFEGANWQLAERAVVLAAAILIDFDFFEARGSG